MAKELDIRKLRIDDFEGLSSLYTQVYGIQQNRPFWNWKYFQSPFGEHAMYIALDKDRIVGEVGTIPVAVKCGEDTVLASQACDITIHPDYQKGGPFFKLYEETIKDNTQRGAIFLYGFSIPRTLKISTRLLKFNDICPVRRWVFILNPAYYLAKKIRFSPLLSVVSIIGRMYIRLRLMKHYRNPGKDIIEIQRFDERFDRFWEKRKGDYELMIVRDSKYLNWRYADHPISRYKIFACLLDGADRADGASGEIAGYIVLTSTVDEVRRGMIMDIMADPSEKKVVDRLLSAAINFFQKEKMDTISLWLPEHVSLVPDIERWGFVRRETPHNLIIRISDQKVRSSKDNFFIKPDNWFFSMGDSDYH